MSVASRMESNIYYGVSEGFGVRYRDVKHENTSAALLSIPNTFSQLTFTSISHIGPRMSSRDSTDVVRDCDDEEERSDELDMVLRKSPLRDTV